MTDIDEDGQREWIGDENCDDWFYDCDIWEMINCDN